MTLNEWYLEYSKLDKMDVWLIKNHISEFKSRPLISLLTPVYNTPKEWLKLCYESVRSQIYENWEWCICDNACDPEISKVLQEFKDQDSRIKIIRLETNQGGAGGTNAALELATGDFIGFLDSDDELVSVTLYLVAHEINETPDVTVIYTDELMTDENGQASSAFFKPDFSPHLLHSEMCTSHLSLYKSTLLKRLKLKESAGSHDYDLILRVIEEVPWSTIKHIPFLCYKYRIHSKSTATTTYSYCVQGAIKALQEHLERIGRQANVYYDWPWYRVQYLPEEWPHVDILVASINSKDILPKFIVNLLAKTDYPDYSIYLCVPESVKKIVIIWFAALVDSGKIKFVERGEKEEFNYSIFANRLNDAAQGPLVCYLNDDIEPMNYSWLREMVSLALHSETGVVGAKLLYPNLTYQHVGVVTGVESGIGPTAAHIFKNYPNDHVGYFGRAKLVGNFSMVTGACWVMRKEIYDQVSGYDPGFKVAYGDVDFCLRVLQAGYYNVYTPYASLLHYESQSRGLDDTKEKQETLIHESNRLRAKFGEFLVNDPFYNLNLSLTSHNFDIAPLDQSRYKKPWKQI
jgi:O-antigen biosynthesis protein